MPAQSGDKTAADFGAMKRLAPAAVPFGLAAPGFRAGFPSWAQTVLGSGISAGALVAVLPNLFLHHLGTHSRTAVALKSS